MTLFQLFTKKPHVDMLDRVLNIFNLENLEDTRIFSKKEIQEKKCVKEMVKLVPELEVYYLPCKRKKYLYDLNPKKMVTILRQIVRCYDHFIFSKERYIQGCKYITYQIMPNDKKIILKSRKKDETYIVSFD